MLGRRLPFLHFQVREMLVSGRVGRTKKKKTQKTIIVRTAPLGISSDYLGYTYTFCWPLPKTTWKTVNKSLEGWDRNGMQWMEAWFVIRGYHQPICN